MSQSLRIWIVASAMLAAIVLPPEKCAAEDKPTHDATKPKLSQITIRPHQGDMLAGYLLDVVRDTVVLSTRDGERRIPLAEAAVIEVTRYDNSVSRALFSGLGALYAGFLLAYKADGSPSFYFAAFDEDNHLGEVFAGVMFSGAGAGLSLLIKNPNHELIEIHDSDQASRAAARLKRYLDKPRGQPRLHFGMTGGFIDTRTYDKARDIYTEAGVNLEWWSGFSLFGSKELEKSGKFNMVRRVSLFYSVKSHVDVGLLLVHAGEPLLWGHTQSGWTVAQTQESTAYFVAGRLHTAEWGRRGNWLIGAGLGLMKSDFQFSSEIYLGPTPTQLNHFLNETKLAGYVFGGLDIPIDRNRSLALGVDYILAPVYTVQGNPDIGIGEQKIRLGNLAITLSMEVHI